MQLSDPLASREGPSAAAARVGLVQQGGQLGAVSENVRSAVREVEEAAGEVSLLGFPECYLTGYVFDSLADAQAAAVAVDSPVLDPLINAVKAANLFVVIGLVERDPRGTLYNSCIALGPEGVIGHYRKQHLPWMGVDRFVAPGPAEQKRRLFDTPFGRVGMMICFDLRFPEAARELALRGADLIVMPTAWPSTASQLADVLTRARALENIVFLAVVDRPDQEGELSFLGRSQLVDVNGEVVKDAGSGVGTYYADFDPSRARSKDLVMTSGQYELQLFSGRRPDCYKSLVDRDPRAGEEGTFS